MIGGTLSDLIQARRYGSLCLGQSLSSVRSTLSFIPKLDSYWEQGASGKQDIGWYALADLEVFFSEANDGVPRASLLSVGPRGRLYESPLGGLLEFDYEGLRPHMLLPDAVAILGKFGIRPKSRTHEFVAFSVGGSADVNFYLDDESDDRGWARLYSIEVA